MPTRQLQYELKKRRPVESLHRRQLEHLGEEQLQQLSDLLEQARRPHVEGEEPA